MVRACSVLLRRAGCRCSFVFGAFLAIIGITATAQVILVSLHFSTERCTIVASDSATVRAVLNQTL